ncbi:hypothetical protein ABEG18_13210 [Alsobacter sp. KACC 23698]|uniref:Uncharacterized protein n=1 Tax=Alsobacter sp. KACC 23698 TaxID=3149229 RepID=A0AAU7J983_9HYPH
MVHQSDLFDLLAYPAAPGAKTDGPSAEAAESMRPSAEYLRGQVLEMLRRHPAGMTADECAQMMRRSVLSIRPRFSELVARSLITDTGERRVNESGRNATVWSERRPA